MQMLNKHFFEIQSKYLNCSNFMICNSQNGDMERNDYPFATIFSWYYVERNITRNRIEALGHHWLLILNTTDYWHHRLGLVWYDKLVVKIKALSRTSSMFFRTKKYNRRPNPIIELHWWETPSWNRVSVRKHKLLHTYTIPCSLLSILV